MKITTFVINLSSVFVLLTIGSLLTIIAFHLVAYEDLIGTFEAVYRSPWKLLQLGLLGFLMIFLGLAYAKTLIKMTEGSALVYESDNGQVRVSQEAIHESVRKSLKKYTVIKEQRIKVAIDFQNVDVKIKLTLWTGVDVAEFVRTLQEEIFASLTRLLGAGSQVQVVIDVIKVLSHEPEGAIQ